MNKTTLTACTTFGCVLPGQYCGHQVTLQGTFWGEKVVVFSQRAVFMDLVGGFWIASGQMYLVGSCYVLERVLDSLWAAVIDKEGEGVTDKLACLTGIWIWIREYGGSNAI